MPVMKCECGVLFYSLEDGRCPQCMYEIGEARSREDYDDKGRRLSPSGPREDLIRVVLSCLGGVVMLEELRGIVHFACKFLETRHVMPPFYFGMSGTGQNSEITAALTCLEHKEVIKILRESSKAAGTHLRPLNWRISAIHSHTSDMEDGDIDYDMAQLVKVLGSHSAPEIRDLLHLHFPQTALRGGIGRTADSISYLFPSSGGREHAESAVSLAEGKYVILPAYTRGKASEHHRGSAAAASQRTGRAYAARSPA
ncbi:hypothetical protein CENSYa_1747 [Cenarchaeum symbiosum A]|uniref:Uncharacterized protein n=1 Tax=Cenarchaeum symbiosum (strain A) TaxID=414004 RepID=A0RYE1_CENSY|nr:hypothetical protein CENSYa_1747 [Cenarchaeum symbiosum A]